MRYKQTQVFIILPERREKQNGEVGKFVLSGFNVLLSETPLEQNILMKQLKALERDN